MSSLKIGDRIAYLRKQKDITQEELAQALGVTNQSVSKWESGSCCPDIQLLPEIAGYFGVSIDELMGYKAADSLNEMSLKIKSLFEGAPKESGFDLAFKLAFLSAEGIFSKRYYKEGGRECKEDDDYYLMGGSWIISEPEGHAAIKGNSVFISSNKRMMKIRRADIGSIAASLRPFTDESVLKVFFALYELTVSSEELYVPVDAISKKCGLAQNRVEDALEKLPVQIDSEGENYRIEGPYMHFAPMLMMFRL